MTDLTAPLLAPPTPLAYDRSASFTVTPHLNATDGDGNPVTWSLGEVDVWVGRASVAVPNTGLTAGGVYDVPVYGQATRGDPAAPPVVLHVADVDADVLQPLSSTVTLDADGRGLLRVRAIKPGPANLVLADAAGDVGGNLFGVGYVRVGADPGGGEPVVGGGAAAPAVGPWFAFVMPTPPVVPVTVGYSLAGSTADPALYAGLSGTVTFPAGVSYVTVPVGLDYGYAKVSAEQTIVVTIDGQLNDAGGAIQASLNVMDQATPTVTVAGAADGATIPVDPEGDDAKLVPVAMSVPYFGHLLDTTLTWDPTQDTLWPDKHVGTVGVDDLGSLLGASFDPYTGLESYTWIGEPPSTVYAQAVAGSRAVDGTSFWLDADVSMDAVSASDPSPAATTRGSTASGTQAGLEIYYNGFLALDRHGVDPVNKVDSGQLVTLSVGWLGPNNPLNDPGTVYHWGIDANITHGFLVGGTVHTDYPDGTPPPQYPSVDASGRPTGYGKSIDVTSQDLAKSSVTFLWIDGSTGGFDKGVSCSVAGPAYFGMAGAVFTVYRPDETVSTAMNAIELTPADGVSDDVSMQLHSRTAADGHTAGIAFNRTDETGTQSWLLGGSYEWVQIGYQTFRYTVQQLPTDPTFQPFAGREYMSYQAGLDNEYPYSTNFFQTFDSPGQGAEGSQERNFGFADYLKMYLMWKPPFANSDWVPLCYVKWHAVATADYIFGQIGQPSKWQVVLDDHKIDGVEQTYEYPKWDSLMLNGKVWQTPSVPTGN